MMKSFPGWTVDSRQFGHYVLDIFYRIQISKNIQERNEQRGRLLKAAAAAPAASSIDDSARCGSGPGCNLVPLPECSASQRDGQ